MSLKFNSIKLKGSDLNYYQFLGIEVNASSSDITKAYRRKALVYHPDKNPNDVDAALLFLQLSKVVEILSDKTTRSEYDSYLRGVTAKVQRTRKVNAEDQKLRDELLEAERLAKVQKTSEQQAAANAKYEAEKENLQRTYEQPKTNYYQPKPTIDPSVQLRTKLNQLQSELGPADTTLKVKWKRSQVTFDEKLLNELFQEFGDLDHILISGKTKSTALVSFNNITGPYQAIQAKLSHDTRFTNLEVGWATGDLSDKAVQILDLMKELTNLPNSNQQKKDISSKLDIYDHVRLTQHLTLSELEHMVFSNAQAAELIRQRKLDNSAV